MPSKLRRSKAGKTERHVCFLSFPAYRLTGYFSSVAAKAKVVSPLSFPPKHVTVFPGFSSKPGRPSLIGGTRPNKSWDECLCYLGFASLLPHCLLDSSSLVPLFRLGGRKGIEVPLRCQRESNEENPR
jgi:hypothetical protein